MRYAILLGLLLVACAGGSLPADYDRSCVTEETFIVDGHSMSPKLHDGEEVTLLKGYQECNEIKQDDIVVYTFVGNPRPLIKFVKAVPGDEWKLDGDTVVVNGRTLTNSEGKEYAVTTRGVRMLSLYTKDYPTIPENTYLILGNEIGGSLDSTRFGLGAGENILGVVK